MALSTNTPRTYELPISRLNNVPVLASATIYLGSAVGHSGGYARALVAGDVFMGFADQKVVDTAGVSGTLTVPVVSSGAILATFSSVAVTDVGKDVYMSADDTFTFTIGSNSFVGRLHRYVTSTTAVVTFNAANPV